MTTDGTAVLLLSGRTGLRLNGARALNGVEPCPECCVLAYSCAAGFGPYTSSPLGGLTFWDDVCQEQQPPPFDPLPPETVDCTWLTTELQGPGKFPPGTGGAVTYWKLHPDFFNGPNSLYFPGGELEQDPFGLYSVSGWSSGTHSLGPAGLINSLGEALGMPNSMTVSWEWSFGLNKWVQINAITVYRGCVMTAELWAQIAEAGFVTGEFPEDIFPSEQTFVWWGDFNPYDTWPFSLHITEPPI